MSRALATAVALILAPALSGCMSAFVDRTPPAVVAAPPKTPPKGMAYLYGSAEGAAQTRQTYRSLIAYVERRLAERPASGVVLTPGTSLAAPAFESCGAKPPAVVFDVDDTVLVDLGYEYNDARYDLASDSARFERWERTGTDKVRPVAGSVEGLRRLRALGVTPVFNTNRKAGNIGYTQISLEKVGLGPAKPGETLFGAGDVTDKKGKDDRRTYIAARWCVLAMAGDQLGDFSDQFDTETDFDRRRALADLPTVDALLGNGWFMLPNPVYGAGIRGDFDQVFPPALRWVDPGA